MAQIVEVNGDFELHCSVCGKKTASFKTIKGVKYGDNDKRDIILYESMLSGTFRTDEDPDHLKQMLIEKQVDRVNKAVKELRWDEVDPKKPSYTYAVGQKPDLDSYCYKCNQVYCKEHFNVEYHGSDYGGIADGTCPNGHHRTLFDDTMSC